MIDNNLGPINLSREPFRHYYSLNGELLGDSNNHYLSIKDRFTGIIVWWNGTKGWFENGLVHRLDGPAIEQANGTKEYRIGGKSLPNTTNEESFKLYVDLLKLKEII